jgi:hypothetical protein
VADHSLIKNKIKWQDAKEGHTIEAAAAALVQRP